MTGRGRAVLIAAGLLLALSVALPAAIASYRHGITVVARSGDVAMSAWLPWSTDGLLIAALVTVWVRRLTGRTVGAGPWAAYAAGMVAVVATNVAAATPTAEGVVVAIWPPVVVAIVLELVALQVTPDHRVPAGDGMGDDPADGWESDDWEGPPDWWADEPTVAPSTIAEYAAARTVHSGPDRLDRDRPEPVGPDRSADVEPVRDRSGPVRLRGVRTADGRTSSGPDRPADRLRSDVGESGRAWSQPVRPRSEPVVDEHLAAVQALADRTGARPTRQAVRDLTGVGAGRADRLRCAVVVAGERADGAAS